MKSLCDILNKDVMRDASSPLSFHQLTSLTLETIPQTSESPIVQDTTDHPDQHSTPDGIIKPSDIVGSGESHNEISLPGKSSSLGIRSSHLTPTIASFL